MTALGPLADHARSLLAGTGVDPTQAVAVASGQAPAHGAAAHALAQGWAVAALHRGEPVPIGEDTATEERQTP